MATEHRALLPVSPYTVRVLRRFLTLVMCACLALQGAGLVSAGEAPCPMESSMEAMVLSGELDAADLPDCCNDMQTWAETGHLCKPALDCAGLVVWAPAPAPRTIGAATASEPVSGLSSTPVSAPPGAPWRPPTGA